MVLAVFVTVCCFVTCCHAFPSLLFSTSKDIRVANVSRPTKVTTIVKELGPNSAVDFYFAGSLICWVDPVMQCTSYNGTHTGSKSTVVTKDVDSTDGLAIDWLTKKLYWTTSGTTNKIEVITLNGVYRKVLFWEDIDQPRAIALVPTESIMFWTDWGEVPKIERADMDGNHDSRKVVVSENIFWPNGLSVDFEGRRIYWTDGRLRFIEGMDFEGRNRKMVTNKGVLYPYALSMYKEKLFFTDWDTLSVNTVDRVIGGEGRELIHCGDTVPIDIKVMDPSRQPFKAIPCHDNNGGCSHLCLLSPKPPGYSCACPTGVKRIDNMTCADGPEEILLLMQSSKIQMISLDSPDYTSTIVQLPLRGIKHGVAIDYDPIDRMLYWTDHEAHLIRRAHLNGSNQEDVITTELKLPDGVAVDWRAHNLYWTDTGTDRIQVSRIDTAYTKVLISSDLREPRGIAVSPDEGLMFWSDWNDKKPKIERAALDGSIRSILVNERLGWPNGIALDVGARRIYWCDAKTDKIEMVKYDGTDRREVITDNVGHVFGLTLLGDYLYWTDWQTRSIESAHKITGADRKLIIDQLANMMGIKAVSVKQNHSNSLNPCAQRNGNCEHLCLNTPTKYVCACQMGYELASNGRSCVVPEAFLLFAKKENIGRISIENAHSDAIIPVSGIKDTGSLDYDINDSRIYWTDVKAKAITRAYINGSNVERIIEYGLESPEGLAVDWIGQNVYWTDTGTKRIEVARVDGKFRKAIIWVGLQEPRSIAVDPTQGYLYWSDWGGSGSLMKARLNGSGVKTLLANVDRVNSLTLDLAEGRIYWCAIQGFIESASLDGSKRTTVLTSPRPFSMSLYQDYIYWSDWKTGGLYSAAKHSGSNQTLLHSKLDQVTSIVVYHGWGHSAWGACSNNGGCSHLCLLQCACPTHYDFVDGSCIPPKTFLLVSTKNAMNRIVLNSSECPDAPLPLHGFKNVKSLDYDPLLNNIYWVDGRTGSIRRWRQNLDGSSGGVGAAVVAGQAAPPFSLAVDPIHRLLFWSSTVEGTINATKLDNGSSIVVIVRTLENEKPRFIGLHYSKGLLFWVGVGRDTRIYRSRMDGVRRTILVNNLPAVSALTVSQQENMVYWMTATAIEAIDVEGNNRREITTGNFQKVGGLSILGNFLYWLHMQTLVSYNRQTGKTKNVYISHHHLSSLTAVSPFSKKDDVRWECVTGEKVSSPIECSFANGGSRGCLGDMFACIGSPGDCVPAKWRCDGVTDCTDSSDEANCPQCPPDTFTCNPGTCIQLAYVCDGTPHCPDNSDEVSCCGVGGGHQCGGGTCLPPSAVCDGWPHCADGSDESLAVCASHSTTARAQFNQHGYLILVGCIVASCLLLAAIALYKCRSRLKPVAATLADPALDPLSPKPGGCTNGSSSRCGKSHAASTVRMSSLQRSASSQPSSTSLMMGYPINPPPSPATTSKELVTLYRPPPPTPCSTDVAHDTDSNYQGDSEPLPPPPTPTSLSPSPSSSTYFHPVPPPSPTP